MPRFIGIGECWLCGNGFSYNPLYDLLFTETPVCADCHIAARVIGFMMGLELLEMPLDMYEPLDVITIHDDEEMT